MAERATIRALGFALAALLFAADQFAKVVAVRMLRLPARPPDDPLVVLPFFRLSWVQNYGISMGFLRAGSEAQRWLLVAMTAAIAAAVAFWLWRERNPTDGLALGLVLGGAAGNILDRARLGYVQDFLDFHIAGVSPFMVFNVADAAITIGVLLLVVRAFLTRRPEEKRNA